MPNPECGTEPKRRRLQVPPIVCGILIHLADTAFEDVEALLALAPADEFADAGNQYVHRGHGLTIVVLAHIERLDLFGIVIHRHRALEMFLGEEALVLGLQIKAKLGGVLEILSARFQNVDGLAVGTARKGLAPPYP